MWFKKHRIDLKEVISNGTLLNEKQLKCLGESGRNSLRFLRSMELNRLHEFCADLEKQTTGFELQLRQERARAKLEKYERDTILAQMQESYYEMNQAKWKIDDPPYHSAGIKAAAIVLFWYFVGKVPGAIAACAASVFFCQQEINSHRVNAVREFERLKEDYEHCGLKYDQFQSSKRLSFH